MKVIAFILACAIGVGAFAFRGTSSEYKAAVKSNASKIEAAEAAALR